jgi:hypothetical protein
MGVKLGTHSNKTVKIEAVLGKNSEDNVSTFETGNRTEYYVTRGFITLVFSQLL